MTRIPVTFRWLVTLVALVVAGATLTPAASAATTRTISVTVSPAVAAVRSVAVFSGTLTKSPARSAVKVQRQDGARWLQVGSGGSTRTGAYKVSVVVPSAVGTYSYRVVAPAKGALAAATSRTVRIVALRKVTTTIKAVPTTVPAGRSSTIRGTVRPYVAGTRVSIQKQVGGTWVGVGPTTVNSTGVFAKSVPTTTATTYRASIARAGRNAPAVTVGVRVDTTPVIGTTSLPAGNVGKVYSFQLQSVGHPGGTWSAGPMPAGLTFNTSTGGITGTPTAAGTSQVVINFTRTGGATAPQKTLPLTINPPLAPSIKTSTLPAADLGKPYSLDLLAVGNPAGTWTASPLPAGLSVNGTTGKISGTPQPAGLGDTSVTIGFTQGSTGVAATPVTLTLHVNPPTITTATIAKPAFLQGYSAQIELSGTVPGTWSLTNPPAGFAINQSGLITNGLVLTVPASLTVVFTITGGPGGTAPITKTYTFP